MSIDIKISKKLIPYKYAVKFLEKRVRDIKYNKKSDLLWILEHPITFTAGIRSSKSEIIDKKIKVIHSNRGGKITLHSPGQKIVYFVIDLSKKKKDIRLLINKIEKSIIEFLKLYNVDGVADRKDIGIWVNEKKISAIGIRVSRWIAYHGCSININNDLNLYKKIKPCGLNNQKITSLKKEKVKIKNINKNLINIFKRNFS
tara:strand:- start:1589 stop:2191 length:603 start_codon:yes stop_codon:yes gene_type:complete